MVLRSNAVEKTIQALCPSSRTVTQVYNQSHSLAVYGYIATGALDQDDLSDPHAWYCSRTEDILRASIEMFGPRPRKRSRASSTSESLMDSQTLMRICQPAFVAWISNHSVGGKQCLRKALRSRIKERSSHRCPRRDLSNVASIPSALYDSLTTDMPSPFCFSG